MEIRLVEMWLRRDVKRWIAGALAGCLAGILALGMGALVSILCGYEGWFPFKLLATVIFGNTATEFGPHMAPIITGLVLLEVLGAILGIAYSHFVFTNSAAGLIPMGVVWGIFSW